MKPKFCSKCGTKLGKGSYCSNCGKRIKVGWKYIIANNITEGVKIFCTGFFLGILIIILTIHLIAPEYLAFVIESAKLANDAYFRSRLDVATMEQMLLSLAQGDRYDLEVEKLRYTNYTNTTGRIIGILGERCPFSISNTTGGIKYLVYDRACIVEETAKIMQNNYYVFDYDFDGSKVCRDKSISYCFVLREFDIPCYFIKTERHVLNLVKVDLDTYLLVDTMNSGRPNTVLLRGFIYGKL